MKGRVNRKIIIIAVVIVLATAMITGVIIIQSIHKQNNMPSEKIIMFGTYEQDGNISNGAEPVEWLVLEEMEDKILVISRYGLDCQKYNQECTTITWENCTLRNWLNNEFYNTAFREEEKASIIDTTIYTAENKYKSGAATTTDNIFCLSKEEAYTYFASDKLRAAKPTAYASGRAENLGTWKGNCRWWLRSSGDLQDYAALVSFGGDVDDVGVAVDVYTVIVRPAMWIEQKAG